MSEYRQSPEEEAGYVCLAEAVAVFQAATVLCHRLLAAASDCLRSDRRSEG